MLWAVVSNTQEVIRAMNVVGLEELGPGEVGVVFDQNVAQCDYQATIGNPSVGSPPTGATIAVALRSTNSDAVYVETKNTGGVETSEPFHLAVFC